MVRKHAFAALGPTLSTLFPYRRFDLAATGYAPTAESSERHAATRRIRDWWKANEAR